MYLCQEKAAKGSDASVSPVWSSACCIPTTRSSLPSSPNPESDEDLSHVEIILVAGAVTLFGGAEYADHGSGKIAGG